MADRVTDSCTLKLLGIGAMASERYAPAGLLIERHDRAIMIDGGPARNLTGQWRTGSSQTSVPSSSPRFAVLLASSSVSSRVLALPPWMMYGSTPSRSCTVRWAPSQLVLDAFLTQLSK